VFIGEVFEVMTQVDLGLTGLTRLIRSLVLMTVIKKLGRHTNHTLRTSTFRLPKPRSHWSATSPRSKHYQQPQHTRTHDNGNYSKVGCPEGAVRPGIGAVRPPPPGNQEILRNTSSEHQNAPRFHQPRSLVKAMLATRKSW
jgi:hypothetical protein